MKKKKVQSAHIDHYLAVFGAVVVGLSVVYLTVSMYTAAIKAEQISLLKYLGAENYTAGIENLEYPDCPDIITINSAAGVPIRHDRCTNNYWYHRDLPLRDNSQEFVGYTWQEAKDFCEALVVGNDNDGNPVSLTRLPTVDELLSLMYAPACGPGEACSYLTDPGQQNSKFFYQQEGLQFANGFYWADMELDADDNESQFIDEPLQAGNESAAAVNMKNGVVSNPVLSKEIGLNVRCIYNKPFSLDNNDADVFNVQWVNGSACTISGGSGRRSQLGYVSDTVCSGTDTSTCPDQGGNTYNDRCFAGFCTTDFTNTSKCQVINCNSDKIPVKGSNGQVLCVTPN